MLSLLLVLVHAFNILMEHDSCIHDMFLLLHVGLDVSIANKGEKIEHKFRGSFCIVLLLNMFLKGGEI